MDIDDYIKPQRKSTPAPVAYTDAWASAQPFYEEGWRACQEGEDSCPYMSGQAAMDYWQHGYVEAAEDESDIREGLDPFLKGKLMFKFDIWPGDRGHDGVSREMSGWLAQKASRDDGH